MNLLVFLKKFQQLFKYEENTFNLMLKDVNPID